MSEELRDRAAAELERARTRTPVRSVGRDDGCECESCREARRAVRDGRWVWAICPSGKEVRSR